MFRAEGLLGNADFDFNSKYQIIFPKSHKLTFITIEYMHRKILHVGVSSFLNHVREIFWPINGHVICRKTVHKCIIFFKAKPIVPFQVMGNLPKERISPDYPFNRLGVDFCGPFVIKNKGQCKAILHKVYICISVCFKFKAVHI